MEWEIEREKEEMEKLQARIIRELEDVINNKNKLMTEYNLDHPNEQLLIELAKNQLKISNNEDLDTIILQDKLDLYERNIKIPDLASMCYENAYMLDNSRAVLLMGDFIKSSIELSKDELLIPIKKFLLTKWAPDVLESNINFFLNDVLPNILYYGLINELSASGLKIEISILDVDTFEQEFGDFFIQITLMTDDKVKEYNNSFLERYLDKNLKEKLSLGSEGSKSIECEFQRFNIFLQNLKEL